MCGIFHLILLRKSTENKEKIVEEFLKLFENDLNVLEMLRKKFFGTFESKFC